jgi:hypothetical protein
MSDEWRLIVSGARGALERRKQAGKHSRRRHRINNMPSTYQTNVVLGGNVDPSLAICT